MVAERIDAAVISRRICEYRDAHGRPCRTWGLDVERSSDGRGLCSRHRRLGGLTPVPNAPTCPHGHTLLPESVYVWRNQRRCRVCHRARGREYVQRQRAQALKTVQTPQPTPPAPKSPDSAPQRPLSVFEQIAVEQARRQAEAKARGPSSFASSLARADADRAVWVERRLTEVLLDPEQVLAAVAEVFCVTEAELRGKRRGEEVMWPRQLACYGLYQWCGGLTLTRIGQLLNRDHTTVMYSRQKMEQLVAQADPDTLRDLREIRAALAERVTR